MFRTWACASCLLLLAAVSIGQTTQASPGSWDQAFQAGTRPASQSMPTPAPAATQPAPSANDLAAKLYARVTPSLVVVQYVWDSEAGSRELAALGVVVAADGLVMAPVAAIPPGIPDAQVRDFKIIVPKDDADDQELDALFLGRDERTNLAFFRTKEKQAWTPLAFTEVPVKPGDAVYSIGLLPKAGGYRSYLDKGAVSATLRGEIPWVMVLGGGLTCVGSPAFNADGQAIGYVNGQGGQPIFLHDSGAAQGDMLAAINNPPNFYVPTRDFELGLQDPPKAGEPMKLPWLGVSQMHGLKKDVAELFGLGETPAVEVGEVIPGSAADKAGLKRQMIITKVNGQPLQRGDEVNELPGILARKLMRMKVGQPVTFTVIAARNEKPREVTVTLEERPKAANLADRYFASDLGFSTRDLVFTDTYRKKLPADQKGVLVAWVKPQSAAEAGKLKPDDLIVECNRQKVTDVAEFKKLYEDFRRLTPQEAVVMVVKREGNTQVIRIEPPR